MVPGITDDRMHHILSVARACYTLAHDRGYSEDFCKRMFMLGYIHDVGYEFAQSPSEHSHISKELLELLGVHDDIAKEAIQHHTMYTASPSVEWEILSLADLTVGSKGKSCDVIDRLQDIKQRYGEYSDQYLTACDVAHTVHLTADNLARLTE